MSTEVEIEEVELEACAARGEAAPHAHRYAIRIDEDRLTVNHPDPTGIELLARVGKKPCAYALVQILRHQDDEFIDPEERVDLRRPGVERFITVHKDDVTITIGEASVTLRRGAVAVSEIKRLGGIADAYVLVQDKDGRLEPLPADGSVDIHGCEVFDSHPPEGGAS